MELPKEMRQLASHILETKAGHFDPSTFEDRYENALVELLKTKQAGLTDAKETAKRPAARVINLMDALRRSVATESGGTKAVAKPARPVRRLRGAMRAQRRDARAPAARDERALIFSRSGLGSLEGSCTAFAEVPCA